MREKEGEHCRAFLHCQVSRCKARHFTHHVQPWNALSSFVPKLKPHLAPALKRTSRKSVLPLLMANSTKLPLASPVEELIQWRASLDPDSTSFVLTRSVKVVRSPCSNAKAAFAWKTKELQQFVCEQSVLNLDLSLPLVF